MMHIFVSNPQPFYYLAKKLGLFDKSLRMDGFPPILLEDSGDPLMPWLLVPHHSPNPTILE